MDIIEDVETLMDMAPECTGFMNRAVDARAGSSIYEINSRSLQLRMHPLPFDMWQSRLQGSSNNGVGLLSRRRRPKGTIQSFSQYPRTSVGHDYASPQKGSRRQIPNDPQPSH
jgi:hypothetical protein